ncbi:cytochrome P450 4d1-like [Zophobas morio]|uniref:cytochrome P450 4d1-like n=1 Tax=Zophobas morio TaxID=2755281 RepID=UPI003083D1F3
MLSVTKDNAYETVRRILDTSRPVVKCWAGSQLFIATSRPSDVEKMLTNFLSKSSFYENINDVMKDTLPTSKVDVWKKHRKMISPSFNLKIVNSFHDVFVKYSKEIVQFLNDVEVCEQVNLVSVFWEQTFDAALGKVVTFR